MISADLATGCIPIRTVMDGRLHACTTAMASGVLTAADICRETLIGKQLVVSTLLRDPLS
jgi:hypothetical protein